MEWNGVEWILVEDAFWSFWVILILLVILCQNLVVFAQKRKKVNFAIRRRQIHPTIFYFFYVRQKTILPNILFFFFQM